MILIISFNDENGLRGTEKIKNSKDCTSGHYGGPAFAFY